MKFKLIFYFGIFLPGLLHLTTSTNSREFKFTDSDGQCWSCSSTFECHRCTVDIESTRSRPCLPPSQLDCMLSMNIGFRYPSRDLPFYYVCTPMHGYERRQCPCDRVFDFNRQCCVYLEDFSTPLDLCFYDETNIREPIPCGVDMRRNKADCLPPTEEECCSRPLRHRFSSNNLAFFYECEADITHHRRIYRTIQCQCDALFDYDRQNCVPADALSRIVCRNPSNTYPFPCFIPTEPPVTHPPVTNPPITNPPPTYPPVTHPPPPIYPPITYPPKIPKTTTTTEKPEETTYHNNFPTLPTNTEPKTTTKYPEFPGGHPGFPTISPKYPTKYPGEPGPHEPTTSTTIPQKTTKRVIIPTQTKNPGIATTTDRSNGGDGNNGNGNQSCMCLPWWPCIMFHC